MLALAPTWLGAVGIAAGLLEIAVAVLVFRTRPDRVLNRTLAFFFLCAGLVEITFFGLRLWWIDPVDVLALGASSVVAVLLFSTSYVMQHLVDARRGEGLTQAAVEQPDREEQVMADKGAPSTPAATTRVAAPRMAARAGLER